MISLGGASPAPPSASPGLSWQTPQGQSSAGSFQLSATKLFIIGVWFNWAVKIQNGITFTITQADGANNSAFGIYDINGNLVLHSAPAKYAATGIKTIAPVESLPLTLQPGVYFLGLTSAGSSLEMDGTSQGNICPFVYYSSFTAFTATTPGTMNASITPPARTIANGGAPIWLID